MTDEESEEETLSYDEREVPLSELADRVDDSADDRGSPDRVENAADRTETANDRPDDGSNDGTDESAADESATDESATDESATDESATDESTAGESATDESTADENPADERPAVEGTSPTSADGEVPALESGEGGDGREGVVDPSSVTDLEPISDSREGDRSGPLSDLVDGVGRRRHEKTEFDELFEREEVGGIDSDALWEQIERDEFDAEGLADREIRDISKRSYCHQCEYFTEPPEMGCTHEGTDILELSSLETFRVADCPVVLEDEALENE